MALATVPSVWPNPRLTATTPQGIAIWRWQQFSDSLDILQFMIRNMAT
jgi:hypothetical protein